MKIKIINFFRYLSKISPRRHSVAKENFAHLETQPNIGKFNYGEEKPPLEQPPQNVRTFNKNLPNPPQYKKPKKNNPLEMNTNKVGETVGDYQNMIKTQEKPTTYPGESKKGNKKNFEKKVVKLKDPNYNPDVTIIDLKEDKSLANFHKAKIGMTEPLKTSKRFLARKERSERKNANNPKGMMKGEDLDQMTGGVNTFCSGGSGDISCALI